MRFFILGLIFILGHFLSITILGDGVRYLDEVFDEVAKIEDVVYANAPDLPFWTESNTVKSSQLLR